MIHPVRGIAIAGGSVPALYAYEPLIQWLDQVLVGGVCGRPGQRVFAGSSMGAIYGLVLALGARPGWITERVQGLDLGALRGSVWSRALAPLRFLRRGGLYSTAAAWSEIEGLITSLGYPADLVLGELPRCLVVYVTPEGGGPALELSSDRTPTVPVVAAVTASMAIPGLFEPVEISIGARRILASDGGLAANHPVSSLRGRGIGPAHALALRVDERADLAATGSAEPLGPLRRLLGLVQTARRAANAAHIPQEYWDRSMIRVILDRAQWYDLTPDPGHIAHYRARGAAAAEEAARRWTT